jgi:hypothetical protein
VVGLNGLGFVGHSRPGRPSTVSIPDLVFDRHQQSVDLAVEMRLGHVAGPLGNPIRPGRRLMIGYALDGSPEAVWERNEVTAAALQDISGQSQPFGQA